MEPQQDVTKVIEVFADLVCPFTHVGLRRLVSHRNDLGRHDVLLRVHAWPLEIVNDARLPRELLVEEIAELRGGVAPDLFRGFNPGQFPMTSLPALAVVARGYRSGLRNGERASLALRDALFEHGRDISDPTELAKIQADLGMDEPEPADDSAVLADLERGRARGVIGSPHFFVDGTGYFCPSLAIERVDSHLRVARDPEGFKAFVDRCFGATCSVPS